MQQSVLRIIGAAACNHGHAPSCLLDANFDHAMMLCVRKRRSLARRSARDKRFGAVLNLPIDKRAKSRLVKFTRFEGRNQRWYRTFEHVSTNPAFIVSQSLAIGWLTSLSFTA